MDKPKNTVTVYCTPWGDFQPPPGWTVDADGKLTDGKPYADGPWIIDGMDQAEVAHKNGQDLQTRINWICYAEGRVKPVSTKTPDDAYVPIKYARLKELLEIEARMQGLDK